MFDLDENFMRIFPFWTKVDLWYILSMATYHLQYLIEKKKFVSSQRSKLFCFPLVGLVQVQKRVALIFTPANFL